MEKLLDRHLLALSDAIAFSKAKPSKVLISEELHDYVKKKHKNLHDQGEDDLPTYYGIPLEKIEKSAGWMLHYG